MSNADAGHLAKARKLRDDIAENAAAMHASEPEGSALPTFADLLKLRADSAIAAAARDARTALATSAEIVARLQKVQARDPMDEFGRTLQLFLANEEKARSELVLENFAAAERSARAAIVAKEQLDYDPN